MTWRATAVAVDAEGRELASASESNEWPWYAAANAANMLAGVLVESGLSEEDVYRIESRTERA